ncbi:hypothetical protein AVEN_191070-1 [Araneus ventricosus]|uniref:Uncharacterized protein n=1 Tax=Araneus ventricosus TaxID=182803 RepID=A0A4Y2AZU8_ARAVE|nr:hypothetical protein AVEN_191070-1 [Araneus ventricosus]
MIYLSLSEVRQLLHIKDIYLYVLLQLSSSQAANTARYKPYYSPCLLLHLNFRDVLTLSIRDRPIRPFKQKTIAVRNVRMSNFHPLSLSVIDFTPAARVFFVRVAPPDVFGEEGSFPTIRTMPAVIVVFEGGSEFPLSLMEELGRSRILRSLYFNGLRNQRVNHGNFMLS